MRAFRCKNCGDNLDVTQDEYCSRECELESLYEKNMECKYCEGSGRGPDNSKGEWTTCRKCCGTGYNQ